MTRGIDAREQKMQCVRLASGVLTGSLPLEVVACVGEAVQRAMVAPRNESLSYMCLSVRKAARAAAGALREV